MAGRRGSKAKFKKVFIAVLKWLSAIIPICGFIYILYYYKQLDFLKEEPKVVSKTEILSESDSTGSISELDRDATLSRVSVDENEWHSVGGIAIHSLVVSNKNKRPIKSMEVEFKYLSDTQAIITSKIVTLKNLIPAGKSAKISGVSVGYVNNSVVGCDLRIVSVKF